MDKKCLSTETFPANLKNAKTAAVGRKKKKSSKFTDRQIRLLIAAVEARPVLWAINGPFKCSKDDAWQEVFKELNFEEIETVKDLKTKWHSLNYAFKQHSEKLRAETVGHGASLSHKVSWEYFELLLFLYDAEDDGEAEVEEESFTKLEPEIEILGSPAPTKIDFLSIQQNDHEYIQNTPPSISVSSRKHLNFTFEDRQPNQDRPDALYLSNPQIQCPESNTKFCNHILDELRLLSATKSRHLRRLLMAKMYDFMESKTSGSRLTA